MASKKSLKAYLLIFINNVYSAIKLDENEVSFVINTQKHSSKKKCKDVVLIQVPEDHYFFLAAKEAVSVLEEKHGTLQKIGVWPYSILPSQRRANRIEERLYYIYTDLLYFLKRKKWLKLYSLIGIDRILLQTDSNFLVKLSCRKLSSKVFDELNSKQDVLDIKYKNIKLGDLIYDTYLRFRYEATVDIKDYFLREIIYIAFVSINTMNKLFSTNKIKFFLTTYSSYIHHGVAVRVALQYGVEVYSEGNLSQHFKNLSINDDYHSACYKKYYSDSIIMENKKNKLFLMESDLVKRFSGGIDDSTSYMKQSAFCSASVPFNEKYDGIMFLHDFFDSPHCWGDMLFVDFYEWCCFTFDLIQKHKLNIAVKLHPNRNEDGVVIDRFKKKYPRVKWLDSGVSNRYIFSSGIKFGISVYGTVLSELAYHGINAISAGDHPAISFDFVHNPKSIDEYKSLILNANNLEIAKNHKESVLSFYYMHTKTHKDGIDIRGRLNKLGITQFQNGGGSEILLKVL